MGIESLYSQIVDDTDMWHSPIHGTKHWMRVRAAALYLAEKTNGDCQVAEYFSILHDCMRENENSDPGHGPRATHYAAHHRGLIDLTNRQFQLLQRACAGHTFARPNGRAGENATLAACWDADRLDIGRVGVKPDGRYMFSHYAKQLIRGT